MSPIDPINPEVPMEVETKAPRRFSYGWRPDVPDRRDRYRAVARRLALGLPESVDLRPAMPMIYEQGELGSCVAQCVSACIEYLQVKQGFPRWPPSRLFLYYNARRIEGTPLEDSGSSIRSGVLAANRWGACYAALWPYQIERFAEPPPPACYEVAENHQALRYERVHQSAEAIQACLADGWPIIFGAAVYTSFESLSVAMTGVVPTPGSDVPARGMPQGHAMVLVGYDRPRNCYLVRNHWGDSWGMAGYCVMSEEYVLHPSLCDDFWCLTALE